MANTLANSLHEFKNGFFLATDIVPGLYEKGDRKLEDIAKDDINTLGLSTFKNMNEKPDSWTSEGVIPFLLGGFTGMAIACATIGGVYLATAGYDACKYAGKKLGIGELDKDEYLNIRI